MVVDKFLRENPCKFEVKTINLDQNVGPGKARNIAAQSATGELLAFLDADDHWLPWHLETILAISTQQGLDGLVINQAPMLAQPKDQSFSKHKLESKQLGLVRFLLIQANYCTPGLAVSKDLFFSVGGFSESRKYAEDFELFIKLRVSCKSWVQILKPRSVVYGKHFYLSGKGLSSRHFDMYIGTSKALVNGLASTRYFWAIPALLAFHSLKYMRRLYKMVLRF